MPAITTPLAIIIAGVLIAAAIALTNRWSFQPISTAGGVAVYRLDRWTGDTALCAAADPGWKIPCSVELPIPHAGQGRASRAG
jgi:hypothetical protein